MQLTQIDLPTTDFLFDLEESGPCDRNSESRSIDRFDRESWEILSCWKEQQADRFGAGTPVPSIPRSQRQFDGDNWFDYCEPWVG